MYLIDRFALRVGNEKGEGEADTVGCCTLRHEHIGLMPLNRVAFDFLGKDSIPYCREVEVDVDVWNNLRKMKACRRFGGQLFNLLTVSTFIF